MMERAAISAGIGLSALSIVALATIRIERFSPWAALGALALGFAATWIATTPRPRGRERTGIAIRTATTVLAFIPLLVAMARPAEPILGQSDAGVYMGVAAHLARTGSLWIHDPLIGAVPAELRGPFLVKERARVGQYEWMLGDIVDPGLPLAEGDVVRPQFLPLYTSWLAIATSIGGAAAALLLPALLATLAILLLGSAVGQAIGPGASLIATLLLALSPVELWFAREPLAATASQLLLAGMMAAIVAWETRPRPILLVLAALLAALSLATQVTAAIYVPGLVAWAALRRARMFLAVWVPLGVAAIAIDRWATPSYLEGSVWQAVQFLPVALRTPGRAAAVISAGILACAVLPVLLSRARPVALSLLATTLLFAYAGWLVLVRPPSFLEVTLHSEDATNVLQLAWYTGAVLLLLALLGTMVAMRPPVGGARLAMLLILLPDPLLLLYNNIVPNLHPWMLKRYIVGTIPFICAMGAAAIAPLFDPRRPLRALVGTALVLWLVIAPLRANATMATLPSLEGARSLVGVATTGMNERACVILEGSAVNLGAPIWLQSGIPALELWGVTLEDRRRRAARSRGFRASGARSTSSRIGGRLRRGACIIPVDLRTLRLVKDAHAGDVEHGTATLYETLVPALPAEILPRSTSESSTSASPPGPSTPRPPRTAPPTAGAACAGCCRGQGR
ncbi:MAG: hypothetical protein U0166_08645 [Acidobacteriota bacterium]